MKQKFGDKLKSLRIQTGKSQAEVADEILDIFGDSVRMSQSTLSALEQRGTAPREDVLEILCDYYGVPISYFFESKPKVNVKSYIDALRRFTPESNERFAHSSEKRYQDDQIEKSLHNLDDEFLDTDYSEEDE